MKITFLGTGGAVATEERDNTSLLVAQGKFLALVDCPGGVVQKIKKAGYLPQNLQAILVTHVHPDDIYGLPSLIHSLMLEDMTLELYGSSASILFCQKLLDLFQLRENKIKCRVRFKELEPAEVVWLTPELSLTSMSMNHHPSSVSFFLAINQEKKIAYSGDTPPDENFFQRVKGCDCVIHDCSAPSRFFELYPQLRMMHTDALTLGRLAEKAEIKRLIPCHFFGEVQFSLTEIIEEIRAFYHRELFVPEDFSSVCI